MRDIREIWGIFIIVVMIIVLIPIMYYTFKNDSSINDKGYLHVFKSNSVKVSRFDELVGAFVPATFPVDEIIIISIADKVITFNNKHISLHIKNVEYDKENNILYTKYICIDKDGLEYNVMLLNRKDIKEYRVMYKIDNSIYDYACIDILKLYN